VWDVAFVTSVSVVPFALLAGLVRYRLLEVDLYVVRTLSRGVVVVLVLTAYAAAEALLRDRMAVLAAAGLTAVAALTGIPLLRRIQGVADRWVTGGRVGQRAVVDEMVAAIAVPDRDQLAVRLCRTVAGSLDVSWVRLVVGGELLATVGEAPSARAPEVAVPLRTADADVGTLECGPRRGGWRRAERAEVEAVGTPAALALRDAQLTAELQARVAELTESRTRLVQAEQTVRRQVERDLHDGAQQQLVALLARLGIARALAGEGAAAASVAEAQELAQQCLRDLRALVAGLHPAVLGERGLTAAVESRAGLMPIPVVVDADPRIADTRFPDDVESAAFFVVSEALANVLKHSGADRARVVLAPLPEGGLRVAVTDEGSGTASPAGSGLSGLRTRVEALGGRFLLHATPGVGTTVVAEFGIESPAVAGV
jgi:signal transduction histidine kinase